MQASHAPWPQRLFPALRGSSIPFCPLPLPRLSPGHSGSPRKQLHSPPGIAPWGLGTRVQDAVRLRPGVRTSITRGQRGCSLNVGMPFLIHMQRARGVHRWISRSQHFAESKTHTSVTGKACEAFPVSRPYLGKRFCSPQLQGTVSKGRT